MKHPLKLVLAASVFLSACSPSLNEQKSLIAQAEKDACYQADQQAKFEQDFEALQNQKWDVDQMACGAVYAYEQARNSLLDIELKLMAVGAQITYMDTLDKLYPKIYKAGEKAKALNLRWEAAKSRTEALLGSVAFLDGLIPEINTLKGIYSLIAIKQNTPPKQQMAALPVAKKLIEEGYAANPEILDGLARVVLGQLYMQLPAFAGGSINKGIEFLEVALEKSPNNMEVAMHLAKAYQAKGENDKWKKLLSDSAHYDIDNINAQDLVDWAYTLGGMASFLGMQAELAHFSAIRHKNLKEKPYLLPRKTTAELGHGGADPITGKDLNEI